MPPKTLIADFAVTTAAERDSQLANALAIAKATATSVGQQGIVITRLNFRRYTVSLSSSVPYGYIHEVDQAQRCLA
ncbi:hypothetical protein QFZ60_002329 [Arthrobacter sp. B2I5]|nr:hypothetical protein [Arthrobacter sp. B2I5]